MVSCSLEAPGFQCPPGSHSALWETPSSAERPRPGCRMRAAQAVGLREDPGEDGPKGPDCVLRCVGEWRKHETPGEETVDSGRGYLGRLPARGDTSAHHWATAARSRWVSAGSKPGCLLAAGQWVPSWAESLRAVPRTQCPSEPVVESPFPPGGGRQRPLSLVHTLPMCTRASTGSHWCSAWWQGRPWPQSIARLWAHRGRYPSRRGLAPGGPAWGSTLWRERVGAARLPCWSRPLPRVEVTGAGHHGCRRSQRVQPLFRESSFCRADGPVSFRAGPGSGVW